MGNIARNHQPDSIEPHVQCLQWDLGKITSLEVSFRGVLGPLWGYDFLASLGSGVLSSG